jgi:3-isopropylmalate/(R)-2-methylmalate dehydratase large subunit
MEERMTVCNMSIEMGGRAGLIQPDQKTFDYLKGKKYAPVDGEWEQALTEWKELYTDSDAVFDLSIEVDASEVVPQVTWGTNPGQVTGIDSLVPSLNELPEE